MAITPTLTWFDLLITLILRAFDMKKTAIWPAYFKQNTAILRLISREISESTGDRPLPGHACMRHPSGRLSWPRFARVDLRGAHPPCQILAGSARDSRPQGACGAPAVHPRRVSGAWVGQPWGARAATAAHIRGGCGADVGHPRGVRAATAAHTWGSCGESAPRQRRIPGAALGRLGGSRVARAR